MPGPDLDDPVDPVDPVDPTDPTDRAEPAGAVPEERIGRTVLSAEQADYDDASLRYLPPPAPLVAIIAGIIGAQVLAAFLFVAVASLGGFDYFAPGGPAFHVGNAVGQLSGGKGFTPVLGINDMSLGLTYALAIPTWLSLSIPILVLGRLYGPGIVRWAGLYVRAKDALVGLPIGIGLQLLAIPGLYWFVLQLFPDEDVSGPARQIISRATSPSDVVILLLLVVVGAPIFEEAFFRGLTLRAMQRRIGSTYAVVGSAMVFAVSHYQQLQFPGLFLFGVVAGVLTLRTGRIGPSVWAHVGFNLATVVILITGNFGS